MTTCFQSIPLGVSPSYPNSVQWSEDNLLAVASGHVVTILNPALPSIPRGLIVLPPTRPFPIGVIKREDLLYGCLLPTCLSRDFQPCVRSISWSPLGLASTYGCFLAVCTTEGRVKLYRFPFCEFTAQWIEVLDISDMLFDYLVDINFGELNCPSNSFEEPENEFGVGSGSESDLPTAVLKKNLKRRRVNNLGRVSTLTKNPFTAFLEEKLFPVSILQESSSIEIFRLHGSQRVWVQGTLNCCTGVKAVATFTESEGTQIGMVEVFLQYDGNPESNLPDYSVSSWGNDIPRVRPFMNAGNLPDECANCNEVEKILRIGQAVEAWTNDRWIEGSFMGFNKTYLWVKFHGNGDIVLLSPNNVRLAPVWAKEWQSWVVSVVNIVMKVPELPKVPRMNGMEKCTENLQTPAMLNSKVPPHKRSLENCSFSQISANQYSSRNALLSSLIVSWLPMLQVSDSSSSNCYSLLAIGAKSGKISFWRINGPSCYSVEQSRIKNNTNLVGLLDAHGAWITAIDWASFALDALDTKVFLATGSADGSVKIWISSSEGLLNSSKINHSPFSLFSEISSSGYMSVSVLSFSAPVHCRPSISLAIGRGSGTIEVWACDLSTRKLDKRGSYDAHDRVVTGLAWDFNGTYLYTCSQDNSVRSWALYGNTLFESPIPSSNLSVGRSVDIPNVSASCFGVGISSGNLVLAVVRSLDVKLLNPMYEAKFMKAVIELSWIGGQQSVNISNKKPDIRIESFSGFCQKELVYWESNILNSLNQHEHEDKPLVVWDITTALFAFKSSSPKYVEHIMVEWVKRSFEISRSSVSVDEIMARVARSVRKITSRRLQLLNIICRRVWLSDLKVKETKSEVRDSTEEDTSLWMKLISESENELRERLVGFSMAAALHHLSCLDPSICGSTHWHPPGLAQMWQWLVLSGNRVNDKLEFLALKVRKLAERCESVDGYVAKEKCGFCSAPVPFESPEVGFCEGVKSHKSPRCSVSMRLCPTSSIWYCMCCERWASELPPHSFFTMPRHCQDFSSFVHQSNSSLPLPIPLCPFCGILLQKRQPEFLLSLSPV